MVFLKVKLLKAYFIIADYRYFQLYPRSLIKPFKISKSLIYSSIESFHNSQKTTPSNWKPLSIKITLWSVIRLEAMVFWRFFHTQKTRLNIVISHMISKSYDTNRQRERLWRWQWWCFWNISNICLWKLEYIGIYTQNQRNKIYMQARKRRISGRANVQLKVPSS